MTAKTYSVPDVSCEHCKRAIEGALGPMKGVSRVLVDIGKKSVDVDFDESVTPESEVLARLDEEGYPVAG